MMMRNKLLLLLAILLGVGMSASAQSGRIVGTILEAGTNEPLTGATVQIVGTTQGGAADFDGNYRILNVRSGTYTLEFRFIGYQAQIIENVLVRTDLNTEVSVRLRPETFVGQEIVVQATQDVVIRDLTSSESRVSRDQIEKLPVQEVGDIIQLQAGVTVGPGGAIHIRGGRATEVSYIVDGVRVTDDYDRGSGLRVENQAIEELQVVSGTFNAEYGQAMSGIVNIVTRAGTNDFRANLNIWGGDYGTRDFQLFEGMPSKVNEFDPMRQYNIEGSFSGPIIKNKLTFFVSGRRFQNTGWLYGRNAYSAMGPLMFSEDLEGNRTWERGVTELPTPAAGQPLVNKFGHVIDFSKPWYTRVEEVTIGGQNFIRYEDSGKRDSALVAMNPFDTYSGQINLQYNVNRVLRFNLIGNYSKEWGSGYSHGGRLSPEGRSSYDRNSYYVNLRTTITPSNTSYMTSNLAIRYNGVESSAYGTPYDPRYFNYDRVTNFVNYVNLPADFYDGQPGRYARYGTNNNIFARSTTSFTGKLEYSSQLNNQHFLKSGIEVQADIMEFQSYNLAPLAVGDNIQLPANLDPDLRARLELGIPAPNTPGHEQWSRSPFLFAAFVQDRIEYESLIINAGIRFDYFVPNGRIPVNSRDPQLFEAHLNRSESFWKDASAKSAISPRLGLAYPISSRGVIHFSYGYFFQIPDYNKLYNGEKLILQRTSGFQGIFGNPDLKPERSIKYEIGLQQELFTGFALNLTAFYEDKRDYVSSGPLNLTSISSVRYGTWINRDYANIRGITMALNQRVSRSLTFGFDYTFSIAEDSNSDPSAEFFAAIARSDTSGSSLARFLTPANWDRTHVFNSSLFYSGNNWGFNLLQRFSSGLPYTPGDDIPRRVGLSASGDVLTNSVRMPFVFTLDFSTYKNFRLGNNTLRVNMNIYNLLDRRNVNFVYGDSGVPTGPLRPPQTFDPGFFENPQAYSEPRRIQVGVQYSF
jgi:outer membrane receptor for ferrienterochelin and colicin